MTSESILFYWSKGAETRRKIIWYMHRCEKRDDPCFINKIADELDLSHVAIKKHIDLLVEEDYIKQMNPSGKPIYLKLTEDGKAVVEEMDR